MSENNFKGFKGTEFKYPLLFAIKGLNNLENITEVESFEGNEHIDELIQAERMESEQEDSTLYFITDDSFRSMCVGLNEGTNGWALLVGLDENNTHQLKNELEERRLKVFAGGSSAKILREKSIQFTDLGPRGSGLIYFAQLMVRYALIYGRDLGGDPHEISHIIEEYAPGAILLLGKPSEAEKKLLQGMLAIGIPIVSKVQDHGLTGHVVVADSVKDMIEGIWKLPNIRARVPERDSPEIPAPSGPIFKNENLKEGEIKYRINSSEFGFILSKHSKIEKDSVNITGEFEKATSFSLLVEIGNPMADPVVTKWVDVIVRRVSNYAKGVKISSNGEQGYELLMTEQTFLKGFTLKHLGNLIITELRNEFPSNGPIRVSFILDREIERKIKPEIDEYLEKREQILTDASEDTLDYFVGCTRCRSFSLGHACTVTPERPAQCSKPWYMLKAYAVLAPNNTYNPCQLIEKGECLDPIKGEYVGVNKSTEDRTNGITRRIFLHSLFEYPHTACSCFQNIAYYIPELDGIAIMDRGFKGKSPGDWTWTKLANLVAGGQYQKGAASIATGYLRSPKFLQADGGYSRIVWMSEKLLYFSKDMIPEKHLKHIGTEKDARSLDELRGFLEKGR